jgi:hypothetical protein
MATVTAGQWIITGTNNPAGTVARMRGLVRKDAVTQEAIEAADSIVMTADGHNTFAMANEIKEWVARHCHYIPDLDEMQVLKPPITLLRDAQSRGVFVGNCADAAMLSAMLLIDVGIPCYFEARAFLKPDAPYQHVVTVAITDHGLVDFDVTRPIGSPDVLVTRRYQLKV